MDPLTHTLTGATVAWAATGRTLGRKAILVGATAALLPDLDILIRSAADPLLAIEHHRGFTHSLFFAPVGGLLTSLPFRARIDPAHWRRLTLATTLAWLSHSLLDAATTYGTQLYWPLSRYRVGVDVISIIDPLFTLIVLTGLLAALTSRKTLANLTLASALVWLVLGLVQRERATAAQTRLANHRNHQIGRAAVFPTVGNTVVWRSIYQTDHTLHIDRLRVPWLGSPTWAPAARLPLATLPAPTTPRMQRDHARLSWFADRWLARDPADPTIIGDARYSLHPDRYTPVWGIRLHPTTTDWINRSRQRKANAPALWRELRGQDPAYHPLP